MGFYSESSTPEFCQDNSIGYLSRRVFQLAQVNLEAVFAPEGISYLQWSALSSIRTGQGNTCAELARDIVYDKGATTRLVDALEANGWVTRHRDADDRRIVNLALTPAGTAIAQRCRSRVIQLWNGWLSDWEETEVNQLIRLLQRLRGTLQQAATDRSFA
jgi:DNA-binding MarR family transcriptional regulator